MLSKGKIGETLKSSVDYEIYEDITHAVEMGQMWNNLWRTIMYLMRIHGEMLKQNPLKRKKEKDGIRDHHYPLNIFPT